MASLYDAVPGIRAEARQLDPAKVFFTLVLMVPFTLGFVVRFVWVAVALLWTGAVTGWRTAARRVESSRGGRSS